MYAECTKLNSITVKSQGRWKQNCFKNTDYKNCTRYRWWNASYKIYVSVKHNNLLTKLCSRQHVSTLTSYHQAIQRTNPRYIIYWGPRWHSGKGAVLPIGRSLVRSQLVSLEFFINIKSFRSHYGPGVDSASNRNEYQEHFLGVKAAGA